MRAQARSSHAPTAETNLPHYPTKLAAGCVPSRLVASMFFRAMIVCLVIALAETGHGILRVRLLNRRVGDHRARQIGVGTASFIILTIAWVTVPWIAPASRGDALGVGALWLAAMLAFEIGLGRLVFHATWDRIASDFDLRRGGLLGFGMLVLFFAPLLLARFHHLF